MKTDERRQAILDAAAQIFREVGYERASMAAISTRLGGSKTTLYNYFESKEELFAAAMIGAMEEQSDEMLELLETDDRDVAAVLRRFGLAYVRFVTSPGALSITRTAIADGASSGLGPALYEAGAKQGWEEIGIYLSRFVASGALRDADPAILSAHLKALLEAGLVEPRLYGAAARFADEAAVDAAINTFMRAFGV
ncbi:TetR/AcrR family transcriptional regulator [Novosphingobium sp. KA1]|uniref:TetR/AcrR family transcriptional regulator n=1 Tax=Novosphingobium sp. (strain KA1) TaxID=164608 RepID=UPI001A8C4C0D|nr:TetR/AcrR family transcriptional regulator [Novosphingobium sp. KA1]